MSGGQHPDDESEWAEPMVNVKRKDVEIAKSNQNQAQLRRSTGVLRKIKN